MSTDTRGAPAGSSAALQGQCRVLLAVAAPHAYPSTLHRRLRWSQTVILPRGSRGSPKVVTMNKVRDYRALEREYITTSISIRELCRRHGISAHSLVVVQAKKGKWQEKREAYQARESATFIERHADRMAAREAEVRIHALDAIDEAITKFRSDMMRTEKRLVCGECVEVPLMTITPRDVALLIDRLQVLFHRPSTITEGRGLSITAEVTPDTLRDFIEATRELAEPVHQESPIPRSPCRLID